MALAITATSASPGASSGIGTSSRCRLLRGSLSRLATPSNMSTSSLWTVVPRYDSGISRVAKSLLLVSPATMASSMCCTASSSRTGWSPLAQATCCDVTSELLGPPQFVPVMRHSVGGVRGRLHEFYEDATGVFGVNKIHPAVRRPPLRRVIQEADATVAQDC